MLCLFTFVFLHSRLLWDDAEVVAWLPLRRQRCIHREHHQEESVPGCHWYHTKEQLPSCPQGSTLTDVFQTLRTLSPVTVFILLAGGWACWEVEVLPRGSAYPSLCPPAGPGHEDHYPTGPGWELQWRCQGHFIPQEPWCSESSWDHQWHNHLFVIVLFFSELVWLLNTLFCTPKHLDASRSGQKLAKVTWMVRWREAPAEKDVMRQVSQKNL